VKLHAVYPCRFPHGSDLLELAFCGVLMRAEGAIREAGVDTRISLVHKDSETRLTRRGFKPKAGNYVFY
jgi:hypothetical protein